MAVLGSLGCDAKHEGAVDAAPLASCPDPRGPLPAYDSDGNGAVGGTGVTATVCHVAAHVYVSPYTTPAGRAILMLDSEADGVLQAPSGSTGGQVTAMLSVDSPSPGVYLSSSDSACGQLDYEFQLPLPPGTDCAGGTPPACPANCSSICSSAGCLPCAPNPPTVNYDANAASDCLGGTNARGGSWRIELTSATPVAGPAPGDYYLVHGTLSANLLEHASSSSATLSLAF